MFFWLIFPIDRNDDAKMIWFAVKSMQRGQNKYLKGFKSGRVLIDHENK